jgi:hypothetical protein
MVQDSDVLYIGLCYMEQIMSHVKRKIGGSGLMKTTHTLGTATKQRIPAVEMPATDITTRGIGTRSAPWDSATSPERQINQFDAMDPVVIM